MTERVLDAIKHIYEAWAKGCKCRLCKAVDDRKTVEEFFKGR